MKLVTIFLLVIVISCSKYYEPSKIVNLNIKSEKYQSGKNIYWKLILSIDKKQLTDLKVDYSIEDNGVFEIKQTINKESDENIFFTQIRCISDKISKIKLINVNGSKEVFKLSF